MQLLWTVLRIIGILILALILLGLGVSGFLRFPKPHEKYVKVYIYEQPLQSTFYYSKAKYIFTPAITDGTEIWPLNTPGYSSSFVSSTDPTDYTYSFVLPSFSYLPVTAQIYNFGLRLDLSDDAIEAYNKDWKVTAVLEPDTEEVTPITIRSYFANDDPSCVMGWFLYGNIPGETVITITLDTGEQVFDFQVTVQPIKEKTTPSQLDIILEKVPAVRPEQ